MQKIYTIYGQQLGQPRGWFGRWITRPILVRGNAALNRWVINSLAPTARVLELGCGLSKGLQQVGAQLITGFVVGIDYSKLMLDTAARQITQLRQHQRAYLMLADAATLPIADATFDCAFAVNVVYFWPNPLATMREIYRVLKPNGRIMLAIRPDALVRRLRFPQLGFASYTAPALAALLEQAGFQAVAIQTQPPTWGLPGLDGTGVTADAPADC